MIKNKFNTITGKDVFTALVIPEKGEKYDNYSIEDICLIIRQCQKLLTIPYKDYQKPIAQLYKYVQLKPRDVRQKPLSARQSWCAQQAIRCIVRDKYIEALYDFIDCIDDYGSGYERYLTDDEVVLYNCVLTCFAEKLQFAGLWQG